MKKFISALCATAISLTTAGLISAPAFSAPLRMQNPVENVVSDTNVIKTKSRYQRRIQRRAANRADRRAKIRQYRRGQNYSRNYRGYDRHDRYRPYRYGYRYQRDYHNDFSPIPFIAGAIIGGALNQAYSRPRVYVGGSAHVQWCSNNYRSYRAWDNTFQPYHGPRKACDSPYG